MTEDVGFAKGSLGEIIGGGEAGLKKNNNNEGAKTKRVCVHN